MENFTYHTPTQVLFGQETEQQTGSLVRAYGGSRVLIHYGSDRVIHSGLMEKIIASLEKEGLTYVMLGGVQPNPRLSLVREGIELCRREQVDFLLAVGGGSVIDSCKAIGYGLANPRQDVWDFYLRRAVPQGCVPVGSVLTIAAAGSEMSNSSVITREDTREKRSCGSEYGRCRFAVMNPALTLTLPAWQTACGCADILMHTMERYFTTAETLSLTDSIAEALMRDVIRNALILRENPEDYPARAAVMWASSLSHNGLTGCGAVSDFATHHLQHELGAMFDVTHGAGLTAVWGSWARYVMDEKPERFARFARQVMGVTEGTTETETALAGIETMENVFRQLGLPVSLGELLPDHQVTGEEIEKMAHQASAGDTMYNGNFKRLTKQDLIEIYQMAR